MSEKIYDVIIIGGGPAGYTAALYTSRAGLSTLLLEKFSAGGQMTETPMIDNYPGFHEGIDGFTLGSYMQTGAERFGAVSERAEVLSVSLSDSPKRIVTDIGEFLGRTVIISTGAVHKHLGLAHEEELIGRGVGYCAACDGMLYRGKTVAVVGGGNSAVSDALLLSKLCKKVYLIHRRDSLRASRVYHETLMSTENIEIKWNTVPTELIYDKKITAVKAENTQSGSSETISVDGLFISIGRDPATELFAGQLTLDPQGYIVADETCSTNIEGVFVAGDVRTKLFRQIVTATSDGAVAAYAAEEFLNSRKS